MGVPSTAQLKAAKVEARAAANKTGRHRRILTRKKLKRERNQSRNARKKESLQQAEQRGRSGASTEAPTSERDESMRKRSASKPVKKGQGSGTPGARAASAKVPKAVQMSKRGGRRRKATWRAMGKG
eukprot:gb/GFBE01020962.1/.p1 GENE.gb/GFBE01020962.1/~~gb/GFBE01020962.1/.p1  ORF type:complete len:127 (+),score=24.33 gb/GFBE01020962.1/:1-381(+)